MGLVGRRGTTLLELMVVMAVWSGLLVLILGFYISATQITKRHERISDAYRKIHEIMESLESMLSRSHIHYVEADEAKPLVVIFSRPLAEQVLTPFGQPLWQSAETLTVEPAPEEKDFRASREPLYAQIVLAGLKQRRVLFKLDVANKINIRKPDAMPPQPGAEYLLQVDIAVPQLGERTSSSKPVSIGDVKGFTYKVFTRFILLDNCSTSTMVAPQPQ